jgi:hypothetical protein
MRYLRTPVILSMVCLGLWLIALPVLADPGQNPGQHGQNCPGGQGCPGTPALPESHYAILLPLGALAVGLICVASLHRRARRRVTE